ncbi:MAG: insulinase family protein [Gammaproteobacteria bacterium]
MFNLIRKQKIDSLKIEVQEYVHEKTGARHFHVAADDNNNSFSIGFATVPQDSTGVAHILEHTSLCGSKKFPVRDPFFMMIRRSLNTFMNAMTSSDWTAYPFSSQSRKDYDNLLEVYLDAVFFPRLDPLDFAQEGHRVEFEAANDPESDLVYKGVVFNEMKGAMSSPISQLWQASNSALFPTTTYHHNSGGEPANIPELTYDQLKEFHAEHYHPSNAVIITYGNFPVEAHQKNIHDWALSKFDHKELDFSVPDEQRFTEPQRISIPYAYDSDEDEIDTSRKTHIVMHWLLDPIIDLEAMMNLQLLSGVLLDNSASPLRLALEKTDLANSPSDLCGLDNSSHEAAFICGVEGTDPDKADQIEKLILGVFEDVATNGVPQEMVESVLHQFELDQREIPSGYGLRLAGNILPIALHKGDPIAALDLDPLLDQLREKIKDPGFIKTLIREKLLDNPHRIRMMMIPDTELSAKKEAEEKQRLAVQKSTLSESEKQQIIKLAEQLEARQNAEDNPEVLPKVGLEDVPTDYPIPSGKTSNVSNYKTSWYDEPTNGLVYENIILPLPAMTEAETAALSLYADCISELGAGDQDYLQMQARQSSVSSGVHASLSIRGSIEDAQTINSFFRMSVSGLNRNHQEFAKVMYDHFSNPRFDETDRLKEIIAQYRASREASITNSGQSFAMSVASSGLSPSAKLGHQWTGLRGIKNLIELDEAFTADKGMDQFVEVLASIHEKVRTATSEFLIVAEQKDHEQIQADLKAIWAGSTTDIIDSFNPHFSAETTKQGWLTSTQVNFCAKAYPTVPSSHPDAVALTVLGRFLHNGYLHTAIREKGGAYGSGAAYDSGTGTFRFFSYRDPRMAETLEDFDQSIKWLLDNKHEYRQLEEAILGVISAIDRPNSPAGEAVQTHMLNLHGRHPEFRQENRKAVLEVSIEDLKRVAATYLHSRNENIAVVSNPANRSDLEKLDLEIVTL